MAADRRGHRNMSTYAPGNDRFWWRRLPVLLIVALLHVLVIGELLRSLVMAVARNDSGLLQASIVPPRRGNTSPPPLLRAPRLSPATRIAPLIAPLVTFPPDLPPPPPPPARTAQPRAVVTVAAAPRSRPGDGPPQLIADPLDADELYPAAERQAFTQGKVVLRICIY
jgi:hypothetical protein